MYCAYILFSERFNRFYYGSTSDIEKRLQQHNVGKSRWSKKGIPWRVIHVEEFNSRSEAVRRERQLKSSHSVAFACLKASELSNV